MDKAKVKLISSMAIFGSIGIFVKYIPLPSQFISFVRACLAIAFLSGMIVLGKRKLEIGRIKKNILLLLFSGTFLATQWILLFESYKYTKVSVATLCYYMAPIFVVLFSPLVNHEKLTGKKIICVFAASAGMVGVSGVLDGAMPSPDELKGMALGLLAAVIYAGVMLLNRKMTDIDGFTICFAEFWVGAIFLFGYCMVSKSFVSFEVLTPKVILLLLIVGFVHTGIAYALFFSAIRELPSQSAAMLSYLDPVLAVVFSTLILKEKLTLPVFLGAVLILASAMASEITIKRKSKTD